MIELKDVLAVAPMKSVPGAAKKADENAFFEVPPVSVISQSVNVAKVAIAISKLRSSVTE